MKGEDSPQGVGGLTINLQLLNSLFQAKLADLRGLAIENDIPKTGNVEQLRAKLIGKLILGDIDLTDSGIKSMQNNDLTEVLGIFGVKKSGSKKSKMQRLWLHLNADPKKLNVSTIGEMTREELHAYCVSLDLPRSGNKTVLMGRVAGVLSSQEKAWGRVKKSLRTGKKVAQPTSTPAHDSAPEPAIQEPLPESDEPVEEIASSITLEEGGGEALVRLEARRAELTSHLREFLLIGREQDEDDVAAFIEDLGRLGFGIGHGVVRERILDELQQMIKLKQHEDQARSTLPGSWREKQALRHLEDVRPQLLDKLDVILEKRGGEIAAARVDFENAALDAKLDLELAAISGRVHGLFDLQVSLRASESEMDPVTARRQRALDTLYRGTHDATPEAMALLGKVETQMEAFERVVETIVRRSEGAFGPPEHALLIRFLERRGWDANQSEVRPRLLAAAGILAAEMGYVDAADIPVLPTAISLDTEKVSEVVDSMREILADMGRAPPTVESALESKSDVEGADSRVKAKLDAADALLRKLNRGESGL
ncbi:MAG TPA: hypothetical protein HA340_07285 [Candidatus Thalassarchaeaceae archaeon]|nr:hypothetical protein [Candidatus Thalassarchaeaceae archaeon]